jgi:DNA repair protein RecO (recombination protein O)
MKIGRRAAEEEPVAMYKSAALVLRCQDWSETSQVVLLLARDAGRVRCLAKGSRRPKNPFGGPLDRWILGEAVFSLRDPNQLAVLVELFETERFEGVRRRLEAFYGASLVTELVVALVPEADAQPEVFDLAVRALALLSDVPADACRAVAYAFAWRLLALLGYSPEMARCVECGTLLKAGAPADFSPVSGGLVCSRCRKPGDACRLSARAVEAVRFLTGADWNEIPRVRLSEATGRQIRTALERRVEELAGKQLSATEYV